MQKNNEFIGSKSIGETAIEHSEREAQWIEDHSCPICGEFRCDGCCNERLIKEEADMYEEEEFEQEEFIEEDEE